MSVLFQCGSRRVIQVSAIFMIVFGIFTKFGALFVTIPDPIIGGAFFILFGKLLIFSLHKKSNNHLYTLRLWLSSVK